MQCKLYARVNGTDKLLSSFEFDRSNSRVNVGPVTNGPVAISLPETTSKEFKLVCTEVQSGDSGFTEIVISEKPESPL